MKININSLFTKAIVLCSFVIILFAGCTGHGDGEVGDLDIRFKLTYNGKPLEMLKNYAYPGTGDSLFFSKIGMYISNVGLTSSDHSHFLKDIDYLNLSAAHLGALAKDGFSYSFKGIPVFDYNNLSFDIGVPKADNAKNPNDFGGSSPLSLLAEYWPAWKSYIFFRPEGKIAAPGSNVPNQNFALHLGGDSALTSISLTKSINFKANMVNVVDVTIDMAKFFNANTTHDIRATKQIHSPDQEPLVVALAKNLQKSIQ
jgi:hypothetical protein